MLPTQGRHPRGPDASLRGETERTVRPFGDALCPVAALAGALAAGASGEALNLRYDFAAIGDGALGRAGASHLAIVGARQALRGDRRVTVVAVISRPTMDPEARRHRDRCKQGRFPLPVASSGADEGCGVVWHPGSHPMAIASADREPTNTGASSSRFYPTVVQRNHGVDLVCLPREFEDPCVGFSATGGALGWRAHRISDGRPAKRQAPALAGTKSFSLSTVSALHPAPSFPFNCTAWTGTKALTAGGVNLSANGGVLPNSSMRPAPNVNGCLHIVAVKCDTRTGHPKSPQVRHALRSAGQRHPREQQEHRPGSFQVFQFVVVRRGEGGRGAPLPP